MGIDNVETDISRAPINSRQPAPEVYGKRNAALPAHPWP